MVNEEIIKRIDSLPDDVKAKIAILAAATGKDPVDLVLDMMLESLDEMEPEEEVSV